MQPRPTRRDIVAPHVHDTVVYVLADHAPCIKTSHDLKAANPMRKTASGPIGRDVRPITSNDLLALTPGSSWMVIVLLCKGHDVVPAAKWVQADVGRLDRIRFYHHGSVDPQPLLQPWADLGLPMPRTDSFQDQKNLSARFGQDIIARIAEDFGPPIRKPPV